MWTVLQKRQVPELLEYLEHNSPNTSSIIANIKFATTVYTPYIMRSGHYYVYKFNGRIDGMIAIYNDGNAFIYTNNFDAQAASTKLLIKSKFHSVWGLSNWLPNLRSLSANIGMQMDSRELITMVREKYDPLPEPEYELMRIDQKFNLNKYIPFIKLCLYEGFGFKPHSRDLKKRMRERTADEPYFLLYKDKTPVSQCHIQSLSKSYGYIAGICTPRMYRRQGYAKQITARACRFIESHGRMSALTVNRTNTNAIKLYRSLSFNPVARMQVYMKARDFTGDENE